MALNVRRAGDADYPRKIRMLVAGPPGSGKTLFASTAPNVLYVNAEGGMMSVIDRQPYVIDLTTTSQLLELRVALDQEPEIREKILGFPVETIVLDTIDEISRLLIRERLDATKKDAMAIQDWGWLGDQLRGILRGFRNLDLNLVVNVHLKSTEDSDTGRTLVGPAIQGAMGDEIPGYVDLAVRLVARPVTRIDAKGQNVMEILRYFQTYPDPQYAWVKDRSGKLPLEFPVNFNDDWKRLDSFIYGGLQSAAQQQVIERPVVTPPVEVPAAPAPEKTVAKAPSTRKKAAQPVAEAPAPVVEPEAAPIPEEEDILAPPVPPADSDLAEDPATGQIVDTKTGEVVQEPEAAVLEEPVEEPKQEQHNNEVPPFYCEECNSEFDNQDQRDLSLIRFRKVLCPGCFREAKSAKTKK